MNMGTQVALVTGASSGIGLDLARKFAAEKFDLVLVARSEDKLREVADGLAREHGITATVLRADLAQPNAASELMRALDERKLEIEVLVNNAGLGMYGPFVEGELAQELRILQVNVVALTELTRLIVPRMIARASGRVLNVASTAAFQPGPLMAVYYASKAYVLSLSEALANEVAGTGVTVTVLCPGPTKTDFFSRAQMAESKLARSRAIMTSAEVAQRGFEGLMRGKTVVIPGLNNRLLANAVRFLPRKTVTRLVRSAQERALEHS
jgi:short-subunit dehydrogenase